MGRAWVLVLVILSGRLVVPRRWRWKRKRA
jgi:hypothetical protein